MSDKKPAADAKLRSDVYQQGYGAAFRAPCPYAADDWRSRTWERGRLAALHYYQCIAADAASAAEPEPDSPPLTDEQCDAIYHALDLWATMKERGCGLPVARRPDCAPGDSAIYQVADDVRDLIRSAAARSGRKNGVDSGG